MSKDYLGTHDFTGATVTGVGGGGTDMFGSTAYTYSFNPNTTTTSSGTAGTGSLSNIVGGIELNTGSTSSSTITATGPSWDAVGYDQDMQFRYFVRSVRASDNGDVRMFAFADNDTASSATKYVGIHISASSGTDTVNAVSKDGTTEQVTDITGSFGTTTGGVLFRCIDLILNANTSGVIKMNGSTLATHSTNYPPNADTTTTVRSFAIRANNSSDSATSELQITGCVAQINF